MKMDRIFARIITNSKVDMGGQQLGLDVIFSIVAEIILFVKYICNIRILWMLPAVNVGSTHMKTGLRILVQVVAVFD